MKNIINYTDSIILANSPSLVKLWSAKFNKEINLINTSSLSKNDILNDNDVKKNISSTYTILFLGRVCIDKGIRELLE